MYSSLSHFHVSSFLQPSDQAVSHNSTTAALVRVPMNPACHILCTCNLSAASNIVECSLLLEILVLPKAQPETKTCVQMVSLGQDFRELKCEIPEKERKPTHGCLMQLTTTVGDWYNECLIWETLIYKTPRSYKMSLTLCLRDKRRSMYPQLRGGVPQVLSSQSQLTQKRCLCP